MQPIQELWIANGQSGTIRLVGGWFVMSRGTLYALVELPLNNDRLVLWRQHGGEPAWYSMLADVGGLDELEGTAWELERDDDGGWYNPRRLEEHEA